MRASRCLAVVAVSFGIGCGASAPGELAGSAVGDSALRAEVHCTGNVCQNGNTITVTPSGGDDTANLQSALDSAAAADHSMNIVLGTGTFVTGPLHVKNLRGALRGAGMGVTVLTNPETPVYVTPVFQRSEPSPSNTWAGVLTFVGGDFSVSDLTIHARGEKPTTGWTVFGETIHAFAFAIDVEGNGGSADAAFARVAIEAEATPDPASFGVNVINGIYFEGLIGFPDAVPPSTSGSFTVQGCHVSGTASGFPTFNLRDARVRITGNTIGTTIDGTEAGDSTGLDFLFADNQVATGFAAFTPFDLCFGPPAGCGLNDSRIQFAGNHVRAAYGFYVDSLFGTDVACRVVGNDVAYDAAAVYLGRNTHDCLVAGSGTVVDDGTNNRVVGQH